MNVQTKNSNFRTAISQRLLRVSSKLGLSGHPSQIYVMLAASLLFSFGRNIAFPYLAMFLNGKIQDGGLGFDSSLVGFMIMIGGLSSTLALLVTGSLCDRFGRKRMMIFSSRNICCLSSRVRERIKQIAPKGFRFCLSRNDEV